ncbi:Mucolipin-2 [Mactra antiquata]
MMSERSYTSTCHINKVIKDEADMRSMESMAANDETLGQENTENSDYQTFSNPRQNNVEDERRTDETLSHSYSHTHHLARIANRVHTGTALPRPSIQRERSLYTPYMEDQLLRKLKFFFMGPHEKIKARGKCPWKLLIQIVKVILVTIQLIQFGYSRSSFVEFAEKSTLAMEHMYLKDWTNAYETMPYPPASGRYALYEIHEIIDHINHATCEYAKTEDDAIGSLKFYRENGTVKPLEMCIKQYNYSYINDTDNNYIIDSHLKQYCLGLDKWNASLPDCAAYNVTEYVKHHHNVTMNTEFFDRLLLVELKFTLKSFRLEMKQRTFPPQLFEADVTIQLDDMNKDGQMLVKLTADLQEKEISGESNNEAEQDTQNAMFVLLDSLVLAITVLSTILCARSVFRAQILRRRTNQYFKDSKGKSLSVSDQCEFLNLWYVTIIINDVLTIVGTGYKIQLETRNLKSSSSTYDYCGLMLGTGSLLAWLGVLRYIGFFKQFNILIVTLKKAFPNMLRFLACCILLYIGFVICGWVVLGPYHLKFRQMSTASECLFSLINGDDMFVTFSATVTDNLLVWYYSRIYLYLFISLFIYAVLNLFIAVIMDTYETIKEYYEHGFPKSELFEFIAQCQEPVHSPMFRREDNSCGPLSLCRLCCCRNNPDRPNEHTSLVS